MLADFCLILLTARPAPTIATSVGRALVFAMVLNLNSCKMICSLQLLARRRKTCLSLPYTCTKAESCFICIQKIYVKFRISAAHIWHFWSWLGQTSWGGHLHLPLPSSKVLTSLRQNTTKFTTSFEGKLQICLHYVGLDDFYAISESRYRRSKCASTIFVFLYSCGKPIVKWYRVLHEVLRFEFELSLGLLHRS